MRALAEGDIVQPTKWVRALEEGRTGKPWYASTFEVVADERDGRVWVRLPGGSVQSTSVGWLTLIQAIEDRMAEELMR
ncbi:MAG TPA: hypothetical protein VMZ50_08400 [Phycisphaerae bacterium]|nr:hypothetical protein [Phycisphaerae bacterium]